MSELQKLPGKVALVTGATQGIGRVTARELARAGATVVLVARDAARGAQVVSEIKTQTGNQDVSLLVGDLSSMADVRRIAAEFLGKHDRLHILVNNAGAMFSRREVTADGFERTFGLNHLSYFLLTNLLLDTLKKSAPARIVNVSSDAHKGARIDFDDLNAEKSFGSWKSYGQSKLANILFTYELARRLKGTGVTANCLHPGVVATGFGRNNGGLAGLFFRLGAVLLKTPEQGARTTLHLATSPAVEGITGKYWKDAREARSTRESYDEGVARRLWDLSAQLVKL